MVMAGSLKIIARAYAHGGNSDVGRSAASLKVGGKGRKSHVGD